MIIDDLLEIDFIEEKMDHIPVLLDEVIKYLDPKDGKVYLDATFGAGGYSRAILEHSNCKVIAIDQDPEVSKFANELYQLFRDRFIFINSNFDNISLVLKEIGIDKIDGMVFDLGVSSMQLDNGHRGFSFLRSAPLDMRMSKNGVSARDVVNNLSEEDLSAIIYKYGEENDARKIARKIVSQRILSPIETTDQLAQIVRSAIGFRKSKIDLATKTFQAIRIYVNDEIGALERVIARAHENLNSKGRLVFVSFHSLEDAIIKSYFKDNSVKKVSRSKYSKEPIENGDAIYNLITRKPVKPSMDEVLKNIRSRSAKLRVAEKL